MACQTTVIASTAAAIAHQYARKASLIASTSRVGKRKRLTEVRQDDREPGQDEGQQEDHGARADDGEQRGVDQRRDDRLTELPGRVQVLRQAPEAQLQHAAPLARADRVHVEAREGPRVVAGQRVGER